MTNEQKYYGMIKNGLGKWVVFTEDYGREAVKKQMADLLKKGWNPKDIRIVNPLDHDCHAMKDIITITLLDGSVQQHEIISDCNLGNFLTYCQMALACPGADRRIKSIQLENLCHRRMAYFEWGDIMLPKRKGISICRENQEDVRELDQNRRAYFKIA